MCLPVTAPVSTAPVLPQLLPCLWSHFPLHNSYGPWSLHSKYLPDYTAIHIKVIYIKLICISNSSEERNGRKVVIAEAEEEATSEAVVKISVCQITLCHSTEKLG